MSKQDKLPALTKSGRPRMKPGTKVKQFDLQKVEDLAASGMTMKNIAVALGVCEATVYGRLRDEEKFKDFNAAFARGRARGEASCAAAITSMAMSEDMDPRTRLRALEFMLERTHGWARPQEIRAEVVSTNTNINVSVKDMSDADIDSRLASLAALYTDQE